MMAVRSFEAKVERFPGTGTWTYATIPFSAEETWGEKGRMRVKGTINGQEITAALMPHGNGLHFIILTKEIRDKAGIKEGDSIKCVLEKDRDAPAEVPAGLQNALVKNSEAESYFNSLPPSHKKEYIKWIEEAKKDETKKNRIAKTIEMLSKKQKLK
jgi:bifunctional DNA-binding transcriptional regulator/antitoxin component of YhaV-PrlF toxin-antitoxin module